MGKVDLEKLRSISFGKRTRDIVHEGRDESGHRTKATTDQLGNTVTEHNTPDDRVDVAIRPPHVKLGGNVKEIPQHG